MNASNLPKWLTGMQAVTWLVTANAELTQRALPRHVLSTRSFAPFDPPKAERSELPADQFGPQRPFSNEELNSFVGDPALWGGVTLFLLGLLANDHTAPGRALGKLLQAVCAGRVATRLASGEQPLLDPARWSEKTLMEHPGDDRVLVMTESSYTLPSKEMPQIPLFDRDDVLQLAHEGPTTVISEDFNKRASSTPAVPATKAKPTPDELTAWYEGRVNSWPASELPPTREDDVSAAKKHFGTGGLKDLVRKARAEKAPSHWKEPGSKGRKKQQANSKGQSGQK
jgi:hypothetical protein